MKIGEYEDSLQLIYDIVANQIKVVILCETENKKKQAYEYLASLPNITRETINEELAELVEMGLVSRLIHVRKQPHYVEYALTNEGVMLAGCIRKMRSVGNVILDKYLEKEKRR
ncbi:winged helix-turn-helix transcriptional regulator [[Eubacterium] hominis]|uniref:winged helix-turn-helix transcriptional regulator n=1 Tax=[Eubacterium] hominis TaxID=2764325 RepID=UPI003A4E4285